MKARNKIPWSVSIPWMSSIRNRISGHNLDVKREVYMKKIFSILFVVFLVFILACPEVFAAVAPGTRTVTVDPVLVEGKISKKIITIAWTGSADDGSIPNTTLNANIVKGWYLLSGETNPGAVAPLADYDIVIQDADSLDLAAGLLMNRHTSTTQLVTGFGANGYPLVRGDLTVVFTNQTNVSATGTLILVFTSE